MHDYYILLHAVESVINLDRIQNTSKIIVIDPLHHELNFPKKSSSKRIINVKHYLPNNDQLRLTRLN